LALNSEINHDSFNTWRQRAEAEVCNLTREQVHGEVDRHGISSTLWSAVKPFLEAAVPREYGGLDAGLMPMALALEALGRRGLGDATIVMTALAAHALRRSGSDALKDLFLPKIARGAAKFCFAATEVAAGHNIFRTQTMAQPDQHGYRINGTKTYISGIDIADYMILICRTTSWEECRKAGFPKTHGITVLLVPTKAEGISLTRMTTRGEGHLHQYQVTLNDVHVESSLTLGEADQGAMALFIAMNPERILFSATMLGVIDYCLSVATDHALKRVVFGERPIASYQAVQHPLADVAIRREALQLLVAKAVTELDLGANPMEVGYLANCAKYLAAETGCKAVDAAITALGGRAFDEAVGLLDLMQTARLLKSAPISDAMILNFVAEHRLGLTRSY